MTVRLEFVGHACFRLLEEGRPTLVMDPYSLTISGMEETGLSVDGDIVIVSSLTDPAHDNVALVNGDPRVINALDVANGRDEANINGQPLAAIPAGRSRITPTAPKTTPCTLSGLEASGSPTWETWDTNWDGRNWRHGKAGATCCWRWWARDSPSRWTPWTG